MLLHKQRFTVTRVCHLLSKINLEYKSQVYIPVTAYTCQSFWLISVIHFTGSKKYRHTYFMHIFSLQSERGMGSCKISFYKKISINMHSRDEIFLLLWSY